MVRGEIFILLIVVFVSTEVFSLTCERPPTPEICQLGAIPLCFAVNVTKCNEAGGRHLRNADFCNHCDVCGKDVGAGGGCNNFEAAPNGMNLMGVCLPPYICSLNHEGVCVRPEECEYNDTSTTTSH